jgi:spore coat protein CotH
VFSVGGNKLSAQEDFYDNNFVREIRIDFYQDNWKQILDSLFSSGDAETRIMADVTIDGSLYKACGIRYKGFSSWNSDEIKNPFSINLDYSYPNQNHLGYSKLKLSNVIYDPSFIREVLSYSIARKYMPASGANYANVYISDTLIGLYTNVEAVDDLFADKHFGSSKNAFFKGNPETLVYPFGQNANLAYTHGADSSGYMPFYQMESESGWTDLYNFINVLNNDTANISQVLNVDRALWMHAFNYSVLNLDSYIAYAQNFYVYKTDNQRFNTILWDLNMSFGSFRHSDGATNFSGSCRQSNTEAIVIIKSFSQ